MCILFFLLSTPSDFCFPSSPFFFFKTACFRTVIFVPFSKRHVILPKSIAKKMQASYSKTHLLSETEWRGLGVQQSRGWVHYMVHRPEPHILLFRRRI